VLGDLRVKKVVPARVRLGVAHETHHEHEAAVEFEEVWALDTSMLAKMLRSAVEDDR
jgi:hypothetical protein